MYLGKLVPIGSIGLVYLPILIYHEKQPNVGVPGNIACFLFHIIHPLAHITFEHIEIQDSRMNLGQVVPSDPGCGIILSSFAAKVENIFKQKGTT